MNPMIGQKVYVVRWGSWSRSYILGEVTKVTPTGRVDVLMPSGLVIRFDSRGYEMGESYRKAQLDFDVEAIKKTIDREAAEMKAVQALNEVKLEENIRPSWGKDAILKGINELKEKLALAEKLANAIPI